MSEDRGLILLTGGSGMIGMHILHHLLLLGHRVRLALRSDSKVPKILASPSIAPHAHLVETCIVPDISAPHAFDAAVQGCSGVIHAASPAVQREIFGTDYQVTIIKPAVEGTLNVLRAAEKEPGVKRVVITSSVGSLTALTNSPDPVVDESCRVPRPEQGKTYPHPLQAYLESKIFAFQATEDFIHQYHPHFIVLNIMPAYTLGPNLLAETPEDTMRAANRFIIDPLTGGQILFPNPGWSVDIVDVAVMHARALSIKCETHENFIAVAHGEGMPWAKLADVVRKHFPNEVKAGVLKPEGAEEMKSTVQRCSGKKAETAFGINFKPFEEQAVSVIRAYLDAKSRC